MPDSLDALWLSTSTSFKGFDRALLKYLSQQFTVAQWEYDQIPDEANSLEKALVLLHDYLKSRPEPIHLMGHSTGGLLGLLYARRYPERVQSLTLLSVGAHPAIDWQTHYYKLRQLLPCSRERVLTQMVGALFGVQERSMVHYLTNLLEQDLDRSLSPHTLLKCASIPPGDVPVPLLVCGSADDTVIDRNELQRWQPWLKSRDRLWICPKGRYFFHYFYPKPVAKQIFSFWQQSELTRPDVNELTGVSMRDA